MKNISLILVRVSLLIVMVIAGFLALFPEWWDLRDMHASSQSNKPSTHLQSDQVDLAASEQLQTLHTENPQEAAAESKEIKSSFDLQQVKLEEPKQTPEKRPMSYKASATAFPDASFRSCVEFRMRREGVLDPSDITRMDCSYKEVSDVTGLDQLAALEELILQGVDVEFIKLGQHPKLRSILITETAVKSLDLTHVHSLQSLNVSRNRGLKEVDLPVQNTIKRLVLDTNALSAIHVPDSEITQFIYLQKNQLESVHLGHMPQIKKLDVSHNQLLSLDTSHMASLSSLMAIHNQLTTIDISQNKQLSELLIAQNNIQELDLSDHREIKELMLFDNPMTLPKVSHLSKLADLAIDEAQYQEMKQSKTVLPFEAKVTKMKHVQILRKK